MVDMRRREVITLWRRGETIWVTNITQACIREDSQLRQAAALCDRIV